MFAFEYLVSALACKYLMSAISIPMCPKAPLKMGLEWSSLWIFGILMWLGLSARPLTMSSHQILEGRCSRLGWRDAALTDGLSDSEDLLSTAEGWVG